MPFAALDLHRKMVESVILDDHGTVLHRDRFPATREALEDFARRHLSHQHKVAVEATMSLCFALRSAKGAGRAPFCGSSSKGCFRPFRNLAGELGMGEALADDLANEKAKVSSGAQRQAVVKGESLLVNVPEQVERFGRGIRSSGRTP
jgi:hypothetical protein